MTDNNLRSSLLEFFGAPSYRPMTKSEIARGLKVPPAARSSFRALLDELTEEGYLTVEKKGLYQVRAKGGRTLTGTLKFHPKGHGMFFPDASDEQNIATGIDLVANSRIQINRRDTGTALDGDRVLVALQKPSPRRQFRVRSEIRDEPEEIRGVVEKVLSRRSGKLVGIFRSKGGFAWVDTDDKAVEGRIEIIGDSTAEPGQLVVVDLGQWQDRYDTPRGRVIEVLGWPGDAGVDIISVIHRFGLRTSFPEDVLAEAQAVAEEIGPKELKRREDWRDKLVITIDPADAKDHDDAIWLEKTSRGWTLAVHIADVSHYIKPGKPMDKEASERGNSTYLVDRVLPMLPTVLSNGICSLKPDVDRLTKCALMEISHEGKLEKAKFFDAVIHSRSKLSYEQAQEILDGKPAPAGSDPYLVPMVKEGWAMASAMRRRRFSNGALDLEMPEIKVRLDSTGKAASYEPVVHTESHQLIEECMLIANEAVARVLREKAKPSIYRVHEDPDPSRLQDYTETAKLHGYKPGDLTNRSHIQKLLDESKGSPEEHVIKLGLLKSLKRAAYSGDPLGHYGLAKTDYTHFTSPIRRYSDLIVHRSLQPFLTNPPKPLDRTPSQGDLREIARHISDTERTSAEAESETKQIKLLEYLTRLTKEEDAPLFDGLITDVRPMGLMVEIPAMGVRGVVKREDLPEGRWRFEAHRKAWASFDGNVIQLGMRIPLRVIAIDMDRRFVDFAVAGRPTSEGTQKNITPPPNRKHQKHQKPQNKSAAKAGPGKAKAGPPKSKSGKPKAGPAKAGPPKAGPAKAAPPKSSGPAEFSRYSSPGKANGKKRRR